MKKFLQITMLSGLLALPSIAALATDASTSTSTTTATTTAAPIAPAMSMSDVLSKLDAAGYNAVKEVELGRNGTYKVEAINSKGQKVEFVVDPAKPVIEKQPQATKMLTASEVAKKLTDAGYTNITKIKFEGSRYDVKATDKQGKTVKMDVNVVTGEITKDWF